MLAIKIIVLSVGAYIINFHLTWLWGLSFQLVPSCFLLLAYVCFLSMRFLAFCFCAEGFTNSTHLFYIAYTYMDSLRPQDFVFNIS